MKRSRREELQRQERRNSRANLRKNTVIVTRDGEVFAQDDHLCEMVEGALYFSVPLGRWLARSPGPGVVLRFN